MNSLLSKNSSLKSLTEKLKKQAAWLRSQPIGQYGRLKKDGKHLFGKGVEIKMPAAIFRDNSYI